jgi:hypothetical protein
LRFRNIDLRCVEIDGEPWFVATDVCRALGLSEHPSGGFGHHLYHLDAGEITPMSDLGVKLPGKGMTHARGVKESGLYKLVMRSSKPEAKDFQHWVTAVVLPAIRKDGVTADNFCEKSASLFTLSPLMDFPRCPPLMRPFVSYAARLDRAGVLFCPKWVYPKGTHGEPPKPVTYGLT